MSGRSEPAIDTLAREMHVTFGMEASALVTPEGVVRIVTWGRRGFAVRDGVRVVPLLLGPLPVRDAVKELRRIRARAR